MAGAPEPSCLARPPCAARSLSRSGATKRAALRLRSLCAQEFAAERATAAKAACEKGAEAGPGAAVPPEPPCGGAPTPTPTPTPKQWASSSSQASAVGATSMAPRAATAHAARAEGEVP